MTVVGLNELRPKIRAWQASSVTTRKPSHPTFKYPMYATLPDTFVGQHVVYVSGESMLEEYKAAMKNKAWDDRGGRDNRVEHDLLRMWAEMTNLALAEYLAEQKLPKLTALGKIPAWLVMANDGVPNAQITKLADAFKSACDGAKSEFYARRRANMA